MIQRRLQPSRTAPKKQSVWRNLTEDAFRTNLLALVRVSGEAPSDPTACSLERWQERHRGGADLIARVLPLDVERRLADDLALIAVPEKDAKTVSAAAIEELHDPPGLTVRIATNQGVTKRTQDAFRAILKLITLRARKC